MAALLALIVGLILYVTLSPFQFRLGAHPGSVLVHLLHSWPSVTGRAFARDSILNFALFLPLGVASCLTMAPHWKRRTAVLQTLAYGFALSLCIEVLQYYDFSRTSSIADLLFNTLGALTGALLGVAFQHRIEALTSAADRHGASAGGMLAACWIGAQLYPFLPMVTRSQIGHSWQRLVASPISWVEVLAGAGAWFVFGLALRAIWGRLPWAWLAFSMLLVPFRLTIWERSVTTSDLAAAALGLLLWAVTGDSIRVGSGWVLMVIAVVLHELAPFRFNAPAHPFSWYPFQATIMSPSNEGVPILLRKAFEYGSLVWLMHAGKYRHMVAGTLLAIGLFGMEMMQTRMPARTPEITDSVLVLLMAVVLRLLG